MHCISLNSIMRNLLKVPPLLCALLLLVVILVNVQQIDAFSFNFSNRNDVRSNIKNEIVFANQHDGYQCQDAATAVTSPLFRSPKNNNIRVVSSASNITFRSNVSSSLSKRSRHMVAVAMAALVLRGGISTSPAYASSPTKSSPNSSTSSQRVAATTTTGNNGKLQKASPSRSSSSNIKKATARAQSSAQKVKMNLDDVDRNKIIKVAAIVTVGAATGTVIIRTNNDKNDKGDVETVNEEVAAAAKKQKTQEAVQVIIDNVEDAKRSALLREKGKMEAAVVDVVDVVDEDSNSNSNNDDVTSSSNTKDGIEKVQDTGPIELMKEDAATFKADNKDETKEKDAVVELGLAESLTARAQDVVEEGFSDSNDVKAPLDEVATETATEDLDQDAATTAAAKKAKDDKDDAEAMAAKAIEEALAAIEFASQDVAHPSILDVFMKAPAKNENRASSKVAERASVSRNSALVPITEDTIEFTSGLVGGAIGFAVGGPAVGALTAAAANYISKAEKGDLKNIVTAVSTKTIQVLNFLSRMERNYELLDLAKGVLDSTLTKAKEQSNIDPSKLEEIEEKLSETKQKMVELDEKYRLVDAGIVAGKVGLRAIGDTIEKGVEKAIDLNEEYDISYQVGAAIEEALEENAFRSRNKSD